MIGLTGSKEAVVAAAKAYRVYYTKADETEKDYLIDHSIISYLIDPNGDFVAFYGKNTEADDMAKMISEHVRSWSSQ
jgi:protein SCO1/2